MLSDTQAKLAASIGLATGIKAVWESINPDNVEDYLVPVAKRCSKNTMADILKLRSVLLDWESKLDTFPMDKLQTASSEAWVVLLEHDALAITPDFLTIVQGSHNIYETHLRKSVYSAAHHIQNVTRGYNDHTESTNSYSYTILDASNQFALLQQRKALQRYFDKVLTALSKPRWVLYRRFYAASVRKPLTAMNPIVDAIYLKYLDKAYDTYSASVMEKCIGRYGVGFDVLQAVAAGWAERGLVAFSILRGVLEMARDVTTHVDRYFSYSIGEAACGMEAFFVMLHYALLRNEFIHQTDGSVLTDDSRLTILLITILDYQIYKNTHDIRMLGVVRAYLLFFRRADWQDDLHCFIHDTALMRTCLNAEQMDAIQRLPSCFELYGDLTSCWERPDTVGRTPSSGDTSSRLFEWFKGNTNTPCRTPRQTALFTVCDTVDTPLLSPLDKAIIFHKRRGGKWDDTRHPTHLTECAFVRDVLEEMSSDASTGPSDSTRKYKSLVEQYRNSRRGLSLFCGTEAQHAALVSAHKTIFYTDPPAITKQPIKQAQSEWGVACSKILLGFSEDPAENELHRTLIQVQTAKLSTNIGNMYKDVLLRCICDVAHEQSLHVYANERTIRRLNGRVQSKFDDIFRDVVAHKIPSHGIFKGVEYGSGGHIKTRMEGLLENCYVRCIEKSNT